MKLTKQIVISATVLMISMLAAPTWAAGLLKPVNSSLPDLDLLSQDVTVDIRDGFSVTTIDQVFDNPNGQDLEAIYSFPVPHHAAVGEFVMWIDGKPVIGEVVEKERAREIYRQEKAAGREVGITEKDEYKTFDIKVYPVRAASQQRIRLKYYQIEQIDMGVGRYVYPLEEGGVDEERNAFWSGKSAVKASFSFTLNLNSSYPVDVLRVPDLPGAKIEQISKQQWRVSLNSGQNPSVEEEGKQAAQATQQAAWNLDKDILVYWRLKDGLPGRVDMITFKEEGAKWGTYMLTVTPGSDIKPAVEGRDWVFVLDISGSMNGKYATLAAGVEKALQKLTPNDRFRIVTFNNGARELTQGYTICTPENVQKYITIVSGVQPTGGTNLYAGLEQGLRGVDSDRPSGILLVTDGVANVGLTQQVEFLKLAASHDVRLFTFIMGNSANVPLLEHLAVATHGFAMTVSNADDVVGKITMAVEKLSHQALHDVELKIDGITVRDQTPKQPGSLYAGQQLVVLGKYREGGKSNISLRGKIGGQDVDYKTTIELPKSDHQFPELERLWAYGSIYDLKRQQAVLGEDPDIRQAITDIATQYGLVTNYTSMIVMRDEAFDQHGIKRQNKTRVEREQQAQANRQSQPVQNHRVDTNKPMFKGNSYRVGSGGGAVNPLMLIPLVGLYLLKRKRR